jgi:flagellar biosynthesis/type III secretory pathway M-ring protein FliF/YscJ
MYADSDISWTTFWAAVCVLFIVYIWITMVVYRRLYKSTPVALAKEKGESKLQRKISEDALQKAHEAEEEFKARDANVSTLQADLDEIKRALRMEIALRGMAEQNLRALIPQYVKSIRKKYSYP